MSGHKLKGMYFYVMIGFYCSVIFNSVLILNLRNHFVGSNLVSDAILFLFTFGWVFIYGFCVAILFQFTFVFLGKIVVQF